MKKASIKSAGVLMQIALANSLIPLFFVFFNSLFSQIFNPYTPIETSILRRFILSFKPGNYLIFLVMASIVIIIIWIYLKPLFRYLKVGSDYEKARIACIKIPWLLIIFHFSAWFIGTFVFYAASNWKTEGGIPFGWAVSTTTSCGLLGAIFTALVLNIILFPLKRKLNMTSINLNEKDHFVRNKEIIILVVMVYFMTVSLGFLGNTYSIHGNESVYPISFVQACIGLGFIFLLFFLGMHLFSRREYFLQINFIKSKLHDITKGEGQLDKRLYLINFDEIGDLTQDINQFIDMLEKINKTILKVIGNTSELSNNLSRIISNNESNFNTFNSTVDEMIQGVSKEENQVAQAQNDIKEIMDTLSQNLSSILNQTGAVEETSSAINEMLASFYNISETANKSDELSKGIREKTEQTTENLKSLVDSMEAIKNSTGRIFDISHVISDIAEQTNLLAINASIEAAHAGKSGVGFAIVAKEIRNLSEQTTRSLNLINNDIQILSQGSEEGVQAVSHMRDSINSMIPLLQDMTHQIAQIAQSMDEEKAASRRIMDSIELFSQSTRKIENLTQAQSDKGSNINKIMDLLKDVSEKTYGLTENLKDQFQLVRDNNKKLRDFYTANTENSRQLDYIVKRFQSN